MCTVVFGGHVNKRSAAQVAMNVYLSNSIESAFKVLGKTKLQAYSKFWVNIIGRFWVNSTGRF